MIKRDFFANSTVKYSSDTSATRTVAAPNRFKIHGHPCASPFDHRDAYSAPANYFTRYLVYSEHHDCIDCNHDQYPYRTAA